MTVSPGWPQDGESPSGTRLSGGDADDHFRSPTLPPTLFKLSNLKEDGPESQQPEQADSGEALAEKPESHSGDNSGPPPNVPSPPAVAASIESVVSRYSQNDQLDLDAGIPLDSDHAYLSTDGRIESTTEQDDSNRSHDSLEGASSPNVHGRTSQSNADPSPQFGSDPPSSGSPNRIRNSVDDRPAGRSWMETIGSHGVVIVLLLIVVAAALISGRGSNDDSSDAGTAEYGDMLQVDLGSEIELPLPEHGEPNSELAIAQNGHDGTSDVASSDLIGLSADQDLESTQTPHGQFVPMDTFQQHAGNVEGLPSRRAETTDVAIASPTTSASSTSASSTSGNSPAESASESKPAADIVASASPTNAASAIAAANPDPLTTEDRVQVNRVRVNQFASSPTDVEIFPASSRIDAGRSDQLPSLESLESPESTDVGQPSVRFSRTPMDMLNPLQFMPEPPSVAPEFSSTPDRPLSN